MLVTHPKCGKQFPANNTHGHCASCHETFVGLAAFDAHWLGTSDDRQCWPPEDLKGQWWRDDHGYWHKGPKLTEEQKATIWTTPTTEEN